MGQASVSKAGMTRRDMIRASAAAGVAAWTAPVILDSFGSPAAAASIPCTGPSVTLSWIYVLYTVNGNHYITGFSTGDSACNSGGSNPSTHGTLCATCGVTGVSFTLNNFTEPPSPTTTPPGATYNLAAACGGAQSTDWTFVGSPGCSTYIGFTNGKIFSQGGATILAAVGFGAGSLQAICPNTNQPGNQICSIEGAL